jgi:hypothetical protein
MVNTSFKASAFCPDYILISAVLIVKNENACNLLFRESDPDRDYTALFTDRRQGLFSAHRQDLPIPVP